MLHFNALYICVYSDVRVVYLVQRRRGHLFDCVGQKSHADASYICNS